MLNTPLELPDAPAALGFAPLLQQVPGFELAEVFLRDPAASNLTASDQSVPSPGGFRELHLVPRNRPRQSEIGESSRDLDLGYRTTGQLTLSRAFLARQETRGEETGNAVYIAALDCREMRLAPEDVDVKVTGDLFRDKLENIAIQSTDLAGAQP